MVLAGAAFFAPHAGKSPAKLRHSQLSVLNALAPVAIPMVTVSAEYRLPPEVEFEPLIQEAAARHNLSPALLRAVIAAESAFDPMAVSSAGAVGLMQLMPALAEELGVSDPFDPRENVMAGARYLSALLDANDGDVRLALASYNAGPGVVERYNGVPPYPETQHYVKTITDMLQMP
jgi:soluble lytic murein transglycosylase-like protein